MWYSNSTFGSEYSMILSAQHVDKTLKFLHAILILVGEQSLLVNLTQTHFCTGNKNVSSVCRYNKKKANLLSLSWFNALGTLL